MFTNSSIVILFIYRESFLILVSIVTLNLSVLSPPQGSIAERAIPVVFIQLAFLRGTKIIFVKAPSARLPFFLIKVRWPKKAF